MWEMWWFFRKTYIETFYSFIPYGIYYYWYFVRMGKTISRRRHLLLVRLVSAFVALGMMINALNKWMFGRVVFNKWIDYVIKVDIAYLVIFLLHEIVIRPWKKKNESPFKYYIGIIKGYVFEGSKELTDNEGKSKVEDEESESIDAKKDSEEHTCEKASKFNFSKITGLWRLGIIPLFMILAVAVFGKINIYHVVQTDYDISTEKKLSRDYKIAGLSDIHYGVSLSKSQLQKVCDRVSEQNVDAVVLMGDVVDEHTTREGLQEVVDAIASIKSKYGIFYIFGNHDKNRYIYRGEPNYTTDELVATMEKAGICVMADDTFTINDEFTIVGRDEDEMPQAGSLLTMDDLLSDVDPDDFVLLLEHKTGNRSSNANYNIDLQLSGHTHGGAAYTTGRKLVKNGGQYNRYGYYTIGKFQSIVSSGVARWGYSYKTDAPAEYIIVTIHSEK